MMIDSARMESLLALENILFDLILDAFRTNDADSAERLFRVWLKLPNRRSPPIGQDAY